MGIERLKENDIDNMISKGRELLNSGNYVEAKDIFENLYKEHPDNKEVQNYLGMVFFKLGLHKEAVRLYKTLLKEMPDSASLHLNLGIIYYKEELFDIALEEFLQSVKFDPKNNKAQNYLGLIYIKKKDYKKALEKFSLTKSEKMIREVKEKLQAANKNIFTMTKEGKKEKEKIAEKADDSKVKSLKGKEKLKIIDIKKDSKKAGGGKISLIKDVAENLRKDTFTNLGDSGFAEIYENLVKLNIYNMAYTKLTLLKSFSGSLSFNGAYKIVRGKQTDSFLGDEKDPIFKISGNGSLILNIKDAAITPLALNNEEFYIKEKHLLAFEKGVAYENSSKVFTEGFDLVKLSGSGIVLIITENKPITQSIDEENPLAIKLEYLIGWYGDLTSHIVKGKENMLKRGEDSRWTTFKGKGYVFCLVK